MTNVIKFSFPNGRRLKDGLLLGGPIHYIRLFACHITAVSQLMHYVNKFLLVYFYIV